MNFASIDSFLAFLETRNAAVEAAQRRGEEIAGRDLVQHAQALIGTEDERWAPLATATIAEKERLGYTGQVSATDPLLRRGELRNSISHRVDERGLILGSDDPIAPYQEFGTGHIPARPFIGLTMFREGPHAAHTIAEHMLAALAGREEPT